jgi:hypothetical protein
MRKILFQTTALLMFAILTYAQEEKEPYKFNFRSIPFGDTLQSVMNKVEGAEVRRGCASIESVEHYGVSHYFQDGLYYIGGLPHFNPELVRHFIITYPQWENIREVGLYFFKQSGDENKNYTLFFVRKMLKPQSGNYKSVFSVLQSSISDEVKTAPATWEINFQDPSMKTEGRRVSYPGEVAVWTLIDKRVFLLVHGSIRFTTRPPEILYFSRAEWDKYITCCNLFEREKKQGILEWGRKAGKDF